MSENVTGRGGTRSGAGRPRGTSVRGETQRFMVYLDAAVAEEVRKLAKARGQSMTTFFEELARKELEHIEIDD